ncbi:MAG: DedA family protein [Candidatus Rokubacteria bacterium]|nr:DedA family protein [Candidatus Rokubacteria bacterium]
MSLDALPGLFVQYGYGIVFTAILLDNAGLPIPGELLLLLFGAVARTGDLDLGLGLLVAWAAALSGDTIGYWLGRLTGDGVLRTYCRMTLGSGTCVRRAVGYYDRYGKATVVVGRFVMGVRAFLSPLAGAAGMPFHRFLLFDSLGALLWSALFLALGYSFGWRLELLRDGYRAGATVLLGAVGVGVSMYLLIKLFRRWRHGPASFREGLVARAVDALQRPPRQARAAERPDTTAPRDDGPNHRLAARVLSGRVNTTIET